jgi:hypothetical protein|tara:strand:+ start:1443 stop:1835 length:393 start_codon:yes stop_codon:yes gene_type:complete
MAQWVAVQDTGEFSIDDLHPEGFFTAELIEYVEAPSIFSDDPEWRFNFKTDAESNPYVTHYTDKVLKQEKKLGVMAVALSGKEYKDIKSEGGLDLDELLGKKCRVIIKHQVSQKGRTYAKIDGFISDQVK